MTDIFVNITLPVSCIGIWKVSRTMQNQLVIQLIREFQLFRFLHRFLSLYRFFRVFISVAANGFKILFC